jgi:two-component system alkaline phosphatase synthesis response regulator PhoP
MADASKKILIIEDETPMLRLLAETFLREGFPLKEHPNLILLDIVMPKMDGMTFLKKLREDPWGKNAVVIILTNLSDAENIAEALNYQAYDFLVKSDWRIEDLVKEVKGKIAEPKITVD